MAVAHFTVTFESRSGQPRDRVVNTFTFEQPGDFWPAGAEADVFTALDSFYEGVHAPSTRSLATWLGLSMTRFVNPVIRAYDVSGSLGGTPSGSPFAMHNMPNLTVPTSSTGLPEEVAVCLSAHANFGTDTEFATGARPRARDRARVFIGPLAGDAVEIAGTNQFSQPTPALQNAILNAGKFLRDDPNTSWVVWSRKNASVKPITAVSVDDAFDIQRRRGKAPTAKLTA